jgi:hypothetical protein
VKTVFALFDDYQNARQAVDALVQKGLDEEEMNALVQAAVAKDALDVGPHEVHVKKTDEIGEKELHGLDAILGGHRPVRLPDVEMVYAAGEIATIMANAAAAPGTSEGQIDELLVEFGLSPQQAGIYGDGIKGGGVLFWVRVEDEQTPEASETLRQHARANLVTST